MDGITVLMLVAGLALLVVGAELLVRGASKLALLAGISPLVIGLTVVAFGTSSPEMAVSIQAGLAGNPDIAVGNVVGSNIFNVLFILGVCALILPLTVNSALVRRDVPIMIGTSILLFVLAAFDGVIQWYDGVLLFAGIIAYTVWSVVQSRRETAAVKAEFAQEYGEKAADPGTERTPLKIAQHLAFVIGGLVLLVLGARWLLDAATTIARSFGVSDLIIGLTIVAAGTSLPEVATSIIATIRKERDIAIGNVVGSNTFNILGILGLSALVTPGGLNVNPLMIQFDIPIMIAVALVCLPIFFTGMSIARWEGALFLASYVAYTLFLILVATQNPALETFGTAMLIMLPLLAVTLIILSVRALRGNRTSAAAS